VWNVKTIVLPVITGTIGTISKTLKKHHNNIKVKHYIKETQQTATLGIAHIFRRVLI
jgi:hypothetical protein